MLQVSGTYALTLQLEGKDIAGSPFAVRVSSAPLDSTNCILSDMEKLSKMRVAERATVVLQLRDVFGNTVTKGGALVEVLAKGAGDVLTSVTDKQNGKYAIDLETTAAGPYQLAICIDSKPCQGSPFEMSVLPADAHPASCDASGRGLERKVTEGLSVNFLVSVRDRFGNLTSGHDDVRVEFNGSGKINSKLTDYCDGTYGVTYESHPAGEYWVSVTVGAEHIAGSPYEVNILAGQSCAAKCGVLGDDIVSGVAGATGTFVVLARNEHGTRRSEGGDRVSATLSSEDGTAIDVLINDRDDGSYEATYTAMSSGEYLLAVLLAAEHVHGSPFALRIAPAPAQAHSCFVASLPPSVIAGSRAALVIHLTDGFGNRQPNDASLLTAKAARATVEQIIDHGDGSVTVHFASEFAGEIEVEVMLSMKHIRGSPYRLSVNAADIDPSKCELTPFEFDSCESGVIAKASLKCADKFGNPRSAEMGAVHAEVRGCGEAAGTGLVPVDIGTGVDGLGTYSLQFVAQHCTSYAVGVKVASHNIFVGTVTVPIASAVHIPSCTVVPPLTQHAVAGQLLSFTIQLMDPLGHPVAAGDQTRFEVETIGSSVVKGSVSNRHDGICEGSLTVCKAGLHFVRVHADGQTIAGGMSRLLVAAAEPSALHSELFTANLADASLGTVTSVLIQLRDVFGNPAHDADGRLSAWLVQSTRVECELKRIGTADGAYVVLVQPRQPGTCTLEVTLDSIPLRGCPASFTVASAELDPKRSSISISSLAGARAPLTAGQELSFVIEGRDTLGQPRGADSRALACTLMCVDSPALKCVPQLCGDRMVFTPTRSGDYVLSSSLDGVAIGTGVQPFSVVAAGRLLRSFSKAESALTAYVPFLHFHSTLYLYVLSARLCMCCLQRSISLVCNAICVLSATLYTSCAALYTCRLTCKRLVCGSSKCTTLQHIGPRGKGHGAFEPEF